MSEKVLELCFRSIVSYLNRDYGKSKLYKSQAIALNKQLEFERSCIYSIQELVSEEVQDRLYKLVG